MFEKAKKYYNYFLILKTLVEFVDDMTGPSVSREEVKKIIIDFADDMINNVEEITVEFVDNKTVIKILEKLIDLIFVGLDFARGGKSVSRNE